MLNTAPRMLLIGALTATAVGHDGAARADAAVAPHSAASANCADKKSDFERAICTDADAKAEDAAMSATYFKTAKRLDPVRKAALLASQRAWLKTRLTEDLSSNLDWFTPADQAIEYLSERAREIVAKFPVEGYEGEADPLIDLRGRLPLIENLSKPFEGSWPGFFRVRGQTTRIGDLYFQNNDRVCGIKEEWFSGHISQTGVVARANGTSATIRFTCKMDDTGQNCAKSRDGKPLWSNVSGQTMKVCAGKLGDRTDDTCVGNGFRKAGFRDTDLRDRPDWIAACLHDDRYPPPEALTGRPGGDPAPR